MLTQPVRCSSTNLETSFRRGSKGLVAEVKVGAARGAVWKRWVGPTTESRPREGANDVLLTVFLHLSLCGTIQTLQASNSILPNECYLYILI